MLKEGAYCQKDGEQLVRDGGDSATFQLFDAILLWQHNYLRKDYCTVQIFLLFFFSFSINTDK